jgi:hypothetical protein
LDTSNRHLDCVSIMMTACVDGRPFSRLHTFQLSEDDRVLLGLDWFEAYKQFCVRSGFLDPCVEGIQMDVCPEGAQCLILMLVTMC